MYMRITEDFVIVCETPQKVFMNKPFLIGFQTLEKAKLKMNEFWYERLLPQFDNAVELLTTDTVTIYFLFYSFFSFIFFFPFVN